MFHFFRTKRAPEAPVRFDADVEIERPAAEVYGLLDWADARNAQRQRGHDVRAVEGAPNRFRVTLTTVENHVFDIAVTDEVVNERYGFQVEVEPKLGRLVTSHELYTLDAAGDRRCRVRLVTMATFAAGMTARQRERELAAMASGCHTALANLKVHAEQGVEALGPR